MKRPNNPRVDQHGLLGISEQAEECSEMSKKLMEMEYVYAKENALLTISQRGSMMRVYLAIIAIVVAAAFALLRDESIDGADLPIIACLSMIMLSVSLYYMNGLIILRSDWFDYVKAMSHIKIYILNLEDPVARAYILNSALMLHPEMVPNRNLTTNFFFHSFVICVFMSTISLFSMTLAILQSTDVLGAPMPSFINFPILVVSLLATLAIISYIIAIMVWKRALM